MHALEIFNLRVINPSEFSDRSSLIWKKGVNQ